MAECVCLQKCIFFNDKMAGMPTTANKMKDQYCKGDFNSCARYKVFDALGSQNVPTDLFPYESSRAIKIIGE